MPLQQEIWLQDIEENLFEGQEFINMSVNHDSFIDNKTIHIPQAGTNPSVEKNRSVLPAPITERTDNEKTYDLNEFTTDPILITDLDELQTSYAKRQSVLSQHVEVLSEDIGTETIFSWAPDGSTDKVVRTTGALTADQPAGTTGTRRLILKEDIFQLAKRMDLENVPQANRNLLMNTSMYHELFAIDALVRKDFMDRANLPDGVIDQLAGFNIMIRPTTVIMDSSNVKKAIGSASTGNDSFSCVAWHQSFVAKAKGDTKVFADEDKPEFYGSVFSALVMHAASRMRTDNKGIFTLSQAVS